MVATARRIGAIVRVEGRGGVVSDMWMCTPRGNGRAGGVVSGSTVQHHYVGVYLREQCVPPSRSSTRVPRVSASSSVVWGAIGGVTGVTRSAAAEDPEEAAGQPRGRCVETGGYGHEAFADIGRRRVRA